MSNRLTIQIVGHPSDKNDVRLSDLIDQLRTIKIALNETAIAVSGIDEPVIDYKVVGLRHSSPSTVVLQPIPLTAKGAAVLPEVVRTFASELQQIKSKGRLLARPSLDRLEAYQGIGMREKNRIQKVKIRYGQQVVTIDRAFQQKLDAIIGPDEGAEGTISGMLEALNFHNTNSFTLFPIVGPKRVQGRFPAHLRPKVKEAIGFYVTVLGKLYYKLWADYPHFISAKDIDIHEPDSQLPTLTSLRGAFTKRLGPLEAQPMNSAEFVDYLRNEDW